MKDNLVQITKNVWLWLHHPDPARVQPSIGVVVGDLETVLIDAGSSPMVAGQLKQALKQEQFPPIKYIIYTHHHWDHVYGACGFGAPVIAHSICREILLEEAKKPWGVEYLKEAIQNNPKLEVSMNARKRAIKDWDAFRIIIPESVFDNSKDIDMGTMTVELEHVGGTHAEDSIIVKVPTDGVMFLGDCFYPPPLHLRGTDISISISMLASLEDEAYSTYIDGHNKPFTRDQLLRLLQMHQPDHTGSSK